ncbi:putative Porin domain superfamily, eukaryotic porin/Tom40 [Helianthus annuus]|nr:putative Porin domain superfamily, eukaryotic porin/Tom40 [Helianthus annuus]
MALNQAPTVGVSTTIGTLTIAIGATAAYEIFTSKLISFAVGINFNRQDSTASLVLGDNGDTLRALYRYRFDVLKKTAAAMEITRRLSANEGYVFGDQTMVNVKFDSCGKLGAILQRKIIPRSFVSLSSELDMKALHKTPKFGLSLVLKP